MKDKKVIFWIVAALILLTGIFFRFWNLASDEPIFDEGIYAFRSIGYLDYLENPAQVTPLQHFTNEVAPAWTALSFHDAPPLFFLIEHIFLTLFGVSMFVARLPSALAGLGSIILVFFVTREIFETIEDEKVRTLKEEAGILAAGLMAITFGAVSVARLTQLESLLFFLELLNIYFFLKFSRDQKYWLLFGTSFGLILLTKYTAVFLIPVYFAHLTIIRSSLLKNWRLYTAFGISTLIFLPVIIYNIALYQTLGHFDLQFAYLFHQKTPEWGGFGGKNQFPFSQFFDNWNIIATIPFSLLTLTGLIYTTFQKKLGKSRFLVPLIFLFAVALLVAVGSAIRFISLLFIPGTILITILFAALISHFPKQKWFIYAGVFIFIASEIFFTTKMVFFERADYGITKLDTYLTNIVGNARPAGTLLTDPNPTLKDTIQKYATRHPATLSKIGFVYDDAIANPAQLWLFSRRQYYQGIPTMPASEFLKKLSGTDSNAFKGFELYIVKGEPGTTLSPINDQRYNNSLQTVFNNIPAAAKTKIMGENNMPAFEIAHISFD
jgi:4-amino-4-deoxy-L-arabinose transferase-like glycosyltransferase